MAGAPGRARPARFSPMLSVLAAATTSPFATSFHDALFWLRETGIFFGDLVKDHLETILGFVLALLVIGRLVLEKRTPSNVFAWGLLMVFVPWVGAPLYFLFGGRKSRRLVRAKMQVNAFAAQLAGGLNVQSPPALGAVAQLAARRRFAYNAFHLLGSGVEAYEAFRSEIARARQSIHVQTYILGRDEYARQIVADLEERARAGVEVKVLVDALGSLGAAGHFLAPLRRAGGRTARFMPMLPLQTKTSANLRNHRKYAVFDRNRAIVGGQNIDRRFLAARDEPGLFTDFSAIIEGPVVAAFNRSFASDWCFASGDSPREFRELLAHVPQSCGPHEIEAMTSGPDIEGDPLWERLLTLVQQCQNELTIVTPYFIPDEVLFCSLIVQAHAGKRIRIILPERSNQPLPDFARHHYLRQLHEAGVEVLLYHGPGEHAEDNPRMIHAKLVLVDNRVAMIGSANVDLRSLFVNFEIGVFLYSPEPIRELTRWTERLLPDCVTYLASGHAGAGANRRLMEDFAHLLGPLL
jgi:cardiolipin synthase